MTHRELGNPRHFVNLLEVVGGVGGWREDSKKEEERGGGC